MSGGEPLGDEGLRLWRAGNCVACHSLYGLGGHLGPDLTNSIRRRGAGYASFVIQNGKGAMPRQDLKDEEVAALVGYLGRVNALGEYPLREKPHAAFGNNR